MYRQFRILICGLTLFMVSCTTSNGGKQGSSIDSSVNGGVNANIINKTWFDIEIYDETRIVPHKNEKTLSLPRLQEGLNGGYSITYKVKLLDDIYVNIRRAENMIIDANQNTAVIESVDFTFESSYFIVKNDSKQTISLIRDTKNTSTVEYIQPIKEINPYTHISAYQDSPYIKPGNKHLYNLAFKNNSFLVEAGQIKPVPFSLDTVCPGFIYEYVFDGKQVSLNDARPLACIGEPTWSRKLDGTGLPVFAEYADRSIKVAIPSNNGVDFITLGAMGDEINKNTVKEYGTNAVLSAMLNIDEDSYLVTGYGTRPSRQFLVKQTTDDEISWTMSFPSRTTGYALNTVIPTKAENTYLVAGTVADSAYMREIEDKGKSGSEVWELLASDVDKNWKNLQSAAYNAKNNTYIITGMYGAIDPISGKQNAFIGFVEQSGKTGKKKNEIPLNYSIVNQIFCDSIGNVYVAGQELRDGIGYAIVQKYTGDGKKLWQQAEEVKANSLYRCAVLDEENGQIVLGGAMNAADKYGNKGTPFLQGLDISNGNELWIEGISPVSKELNLVTGLQRAKGYGFIADLFGTNGQNNLFILARLNARGKLINHEAH